jgi:hypothetical protein
MEEAMNYYNFYRESNKFDDILNDSSIKKHIIERTTWTSFLRICVNDDDKLKSYITLKYGDEMRSNLTEDYSPIPNKDYIPIRH